MDQHDGRFVTLPAGHRIWVRRGGPTPPVEGITDVFLHGLGGSSLPFRACTEVVEAIGASTLLIDLRGHGLSEVPEGGGLSIDDMTDDVLRVLEAEDVAHANLIGHCLGGIIAMRAAQLRPELAASVVLVASSHRFGRGWRGMQRRLVARSFDRSLKTFAPRYRLARRVAQFDSTVFENDADWYWPRLRQDWAHTSPRTVSKTIRAMCDADMSDAAEGLTARVCVVHGRRDAFIPAIEAWELARATRAERFELLLNEGHASLLLREGSPLPGIVREFVHG